MLNKAYLALGLFVAALILSLGLYYGVYGVDLKAAVYPGNISFGERAVFKVTARGPSDIEIDISNGKVVLDGFVRMKEGWSERVFLWRKRKDLWWSFTSEVTGERQIQPIVVKFIDPEGVERSIKTEPVAVTVKTLVNLKDDSIYTTRIEGSMVGAGDVSTGGGSLRSVDGDIRIKIVDERSPLGIMDKNELLITLGACFLGVTIFYILFSLLSGRAPKKAPVPPAKALLTRLAELESRLKSCNEGQRELYYEFSSCLREYLKTILSISSQEPTTKDLIEIIDKTGYIDPGKRPAYKELLIACDTIKYSASVNSDSLKLSSYIETLRGLAGVVPEAGAKEKEGMRS